MGLAPPGVGPALDQARGGGCLLHPLLPAALRDLQADGGHAADPGPERAGEGGGESAAEWGQQPVGPGHADAPLQHALHAIHLLPHWHASHSGIDTSASHSGVASSASRSGVDSTASHSGIGNRAKACCGNAVWGLHPGCSVAARTDS